MTTLLTNFPTSHSVYTGVQTVTMSTESSKNGAATIVSYEFIWTRRTRVS